MEMTYDGALVMPSNYTLMDEDEMMYLDGGTIYKFGLSASKCKSIANFLNIGATISTIVGAIVAIAAVIPGLQISVAGGIVLAVAGVALTLSANFFSNAANKGGCYIQYNTSTKKFSKGYGY